MQSARITPRFVASSRVRDDVVAYRRVYTIRRVMTQYRVPHTVDVISIRPSRPARLERASRDASSSTTTARDTIRAFATSRAFPCLSRARPRAMSRDRAR